MNTVIKATDQTPEIIINEEENTISFIGIMIPENPISHFAKISEIIMKRYNSDKDLTLEFELEYFNTGSAKYLFDLLQKFDNKSKVLVKWIYETDDEDIFETGKDYEELTGLRFEFIEREV